MGFEQTQAVSPETDYKPHPLSALREERGRDSGEGGREGSFEIDGERLYVHAHQHQKVILVILFFQTGFSHTPTHTFMCSVNTTAHIFVFQQQRETPVEMYSVWPHNLIVAHPDQLHNSCTGLCKLVRESAIMYLQFTHGLGANLSKCKRLWSHAVSCCIDLWYSRAIDFLCEEREELGGKWKKTTKAQTMAPCSSRESFIKETWNSAFPLLFGLTLRSLQICPQWPLKSRKAMATTAKCHFPLYPRSDCCRKCRYSSSGDGVCDDLAQGPCLDANSNITPIKI